MTALVSPEVLSQVKGWARYVEAKLGFRNHWYPIRFAHEVLEQTPVRTVFGLHREVASNWRIAAENGFDAGHVYIHKDSILLKGNDIALPLGFAPGSSAQLTRSEIEPGRPQLIIEVRRLRCARKQCKYPTLRFSKEINGEY